MNEAWRASILVFALACGSSSEPIGPSATPVASHDRRRGERDPSALNDLTTGVAVLERSLAWSRRLPEGPALWLPSGPLAYGAPDGSVRLIDEHTDVELGRLPGAVVGLQLDPVDGRLSATDGHRVLQWDLSTRRLLADVVPPFEALTHVGFAGDGTLRLAGKLAGDAACARRADGTCTPLRRGAEAEWEPTRGLLAPVRWRPLPLDRSFALPGTSPRTGRWDGSRLVLPDGRPLQVDEHGARLSTDGTRVLVDEGSGALEVRRLAGTIVLPGSARWSARSTLYAFDPREELVVMADGDGLRRWALPAGVPFGARFGDGCGGAGWDERGERFAARCGADLVVFDREAREVSRTASPSVDALRPPQWLSGRDAWWFAGEVEGVLWQPGHDPVPVVYEVGEQRRVEDLAVGHDGRRATVRSQGRWFQAELGDDSLTIGAVVPLDPALHPDDVLPTADAHTWIASYGEGVQWIGSDGSVRATVPEGFVPPRNHSGSSSLSADAARELHHVRTGVCPDLAGDDRILDRDERLSHDGAFVASGEIVEVATGRLVSQLDARALMAQQAAVDAEGRWLVVEDGWSGVLAFDLTTATPVQRFADTGLVKLYDGGRLVVSGAKELRTLDLATGNALVTRPLERQTQAVDQDLVLGQDGDALVLVALPGLDEVDRIATGLKYPRVELAPGGRLAWVSSEGGTRLVDVPGHAVLLDLPVQSDVAWSAGGAPAWSESGRPAVWVDGTKRLMPSDVTSDPESRPRARPPQWSGERIAYRQEGRSFGWDPRTGEVGLDLHRDRGVHTAPTPPAGIDVVIEDRVIGVRDADGTLRAQAIVFWDGDFALFTAGKAIGRDRAERVLVRADSGPDVPLFSPWSPPVTPPAPVGRGVCRDARGRR